MNTEVIADSTFYICFLDDINYTEGLNKLFKSKKFNFVIGPIVETEIRRSKNYPKINSALTSVKKSPPPFNYGEIVKPFLSITEIKKGEHEVIGIAIVYTLQGRDFIVILDEDEPRRVIESRIAGIKPKMTGTIGFIKSCHCEYHIYSQDETIEILMKIQKSKFRVPEKIVSSTIELIRMGCLQ